VLCALGCNVLEPRSCAASTASSRKAFHRARRYALYAVAALREARGQWTEALTLYQRALDIDGRGPEIKTRIGAVPANCVKMPSPIRLLRRPRAAARLRPALVRAGAMQESARRPERAQSAALEAVRLDPERYETSLWRLTWQSCAAIARCLAAA